MAMEEEKKKNNNYIIFLPLRPPYLKVYTLAYYY